MSILKYENIYGHNQLDKQRCKWKWSYRVFAQNGATTDHAIPELLLMLSGLQSYSNNVASAGFKGACSVFFLFKTCFYCAEKSSIIKKSNSTTHLEIFTDRVHIRLWPLSSQLVHAYFVANHWLNWSQYKAYGISQFGTVVWAKAWTSIQLLLMCTLSANTWTYFFTSNK